MKRFSEKRVTLINLRPVKNVSFDMRYELPTLFRKVKLALVQQTEEQTYKFTGSQRECSFMLMVSCFSIFLFAQHGQTLTGVSPEHAQIVGSV